MAPDLLSLDTPVVVAHRGGAGLRPENTLTAFEHAVSLGADAIECDVHLSGDGEVVVIHDATVDRTTNGHGAVASLTAAQLGALDAAWAFEGPPGQPMFREKGIGVPRLADVFQRLPGTKVVIELKGDDPAIVPPVLDVIRSQGRQGDVILGGFSHRVLLAVRTQAAELVTSASSTEARAAVRRAWCGWPPRDTGCRLFQMPFHYRGRQILRRRLVQAVRRVAVPVHAWVVDDPDDMRLLLGWGVTGIITDRPDLARAVLARSR